MKSTRSIAHILLCLLAFVSFSFAANPLSYPRGLALDKKGNLYVANAGGNNIVVFGPGYSRILSDTITQGISGPTAVAFDPQGNLWVANYGSSNGGASGSISEYTNGVQNTNASITNGIQGPTAMTIDAYGNLWVLNAYTNVTVYGSTFAYNYPTTLIRTITLGSSIYSVAAAPGGIISFATPSVVIFSAINPALMNGDPYQGVEAADTNVFALASDSSGNIYMGSSDNSVQINVALPGIGAFVQPFLQLPFQVAGIAVDSVRGRVYLSNYANSTIAVYSTAGVLLHTIQ